jgi:hypothetical protein
MKPELVVVKGPHRGLTKALDSSKELFIGRSRSSDICLQDDKKVSQLHAKLLPVGPERFILEDLGSTNGTYVNGKRMEQTPVRSGDRLKIGHSLIIYRTDANQIRPSDFYINEDSGDDLSSLSADHITLFSKVLKHLSMSDNAAVALSEILEMLTHAIGTSRAIAFLRDPMSGITNQVANFSVHVGGPEHPMDAHCLKRVAAAQKYVGPDAGESGGAAAVPLRIGGVVSGALYFDCPAEVRVTVHNEETLLTAVADCVSLALSKDRHCRVAEVAAEIIELIPLRDSVHSADATATLTNILSVYKEVASARGVSLTSDIQDNLLVACDEIILSRALDRLCEHVVMVCGGAVHVATRQTPDNSEVQISVSYSGRGFDAQGLAHIFHQQGVAEDLRFALSHGLAGVLAFCRGAFEIGGGRITVTSQGSDHGAAFLVALPTSKKAAEREPSKLDRRSTERYL